MLTVGSTMRIPLLYRREYSHWVERFMKFLEEQTDEEAMINSIKNGDQPLPRVTQVSIFGTSSTEQPPLKDKSMWSDQEKRIQKIDPKDLRPTLYDEKVIGLGYTLMFLIHSNEALEIEKFKRSSENKYEFSYDYRNLNASYVNEKINFEDDYFQEIINPDFGKIDSLFQQTSSLNHMFRMMNDLLDDNNFFIFDDESVKIYSVSKMPFRKKPRDSMNVCSKSNMIKSLPRTVPKWLPKLQPLAEPITKWFPRVKRQIDKISKTPNSPGPIYKWIVQIYLWIIDPGCSNLMTEIEEFKRARENKIKFAYDYGNLNASYVNEKIKILDDYFQEIINSDFKKIDSPFQQTSSLKPYVPNVILEKIIIDLEDEVKKGSSNTSNVDLSCVCVSKLNKNVKRYSRKELLSCNNSHLGETSSAYVSNDAMNVSCNFRMYDLFDENNLFIFDDESIRISPVSKMPFWEKPRESINIVQICLWIIDSGCSKHMTGNRALLTNFVEKFLGTVRFGNNDFVVIAGYGDVVIGSMTIKKVYYVEGLGHNLFNVGQFCDKGLERVRTDNGTEFKNKILAKFFDEVRITQQFSAARTPQQNGVVERRNQTLVKAARTMLTFANLPSIRRLGLENLNVRALLCIERNQVDSLRHHMALLQEEFRQIYRDRDDARRRLERLENGGNENRNHGDGGNNGNGNPNENGRGAMPVAHVCTYQDFVKCQRLNFKGTQGVVAAYTQRFQELTLLCTRMAPEEKDRFERYVGGLLDNIQRNVMSAKPTRLQDAIRLANSLMDQKLKEDQMWPEHIWLVVMKKDYPKMKNQNHGNKPVIPKARGKAYTIGGGDVNPGSNVVMDVSYVVELADGRSSETNIVLRGYTIGLLGHPFNIDLIPVDLDSFDVIIDMDWLASNHAVIVCDEKIVRIPF
nr:integrase, catalytic region, zinc finger, CCHC-type, peptidase aspartic, catalytic [Tanacetum cinerariifolium]